MLQLAFLRNRYSFYTSDVIIGGAWTRTCIENNFRNVGWLGVCVGGGGVVFIVADKLMRVIIAQDTHKGSW